MRAPSLLSAAAVFALASAHGYGKDWVQTIPSCWIQCLDETDAGCDLSSCICSASQSDSFLPPAVSCAAANCDSEDFSSLGPFLFSVQAYCGAAGNPIPTEIVSSAFCAATETPQASSTQHAKHTSIAHTSKDTGDSVTKTTTTTVTQTTTDSDSNTIIIIVPVVVGPGSISLGKTITSTVDGKSSASATPSSAVASPSATPGTTAAASTQARESQIASSSTSSAAAQKTQTGNGSPFDNMQSSAPRWQTSELLVAVSTILGMLLSL